jgi:hypothetical protein
MTKFLYNEIYSEDDLWKLFGINPTGHHHIRVEEVSMNLRFNKDNILQQQIGIELIPDNDYEYSYDYKKFGLMYP